MTRGTTIAIDESGDQDDHRYTRLPGKASPSGYDPDFLGTRIDVPILDASIQDDAVLWEETEIIPYTHFSLCLSKTRRFAHWVAWNIDGASIKLLSRTNLTFTKDPRLASDSQIGNELYSDNRLDRGHIARRADLTWGTLPEAQQANQDSGSGSEEDRPGNSR